MTAILVGGEKRHPDLVSKTEAGYPFCRALGREAVRQNIDGFLTPSARHDGGTCAPAFAEAAIAQLKPNHRGRFAVEEGEVRFIAM